MDFGIVHAKVDEIGYITHAENLGYTHCWVTDSQMIRSNSWTVLALAAQQTRTMRLGTGVNVPGLRLARALASTGPAYLAMQYIGEEAFMASAREAAAGLYVEGIGVRAEVELQFLVGVVPA